MTRAFVVDAFTDVAFRGNPAGVVLLDAAADPSWMQDVAAEFRHAETAFVVRREDGDHDLRWFTPLVEVDLCGHATLASTHVLNSVGGSGPFTFHTRSGPLRTRVDDGVITMDFPAKQPRPITEPSGLSAALGAAPLSVHSDGSDIVVDLVDAPAVAALVPDLRALARLECRGVVVTAPATAGADHDFVSRFFGPRVGVDEDPVTGSAHCALGPLWASRLGRTDLVGVQLSARGGRVAVRVSGAGRVELRGTAVVVLEGTLHG